jgi:hypothetical protein
VHCLFVTLSFIIRSDQSWREIVPVAARAGRTIDESSNLIGQYSKFQSNSAVYWSPTERFLEFGLRKRAVIGWNKLHQCLTVVTAPTIGDGSAFMFLR